MSDVKATAVGAVGRRRVWQWGLAAAAAPALAVAPGAKAAATEAKIGSLAVTEESDVASAWMLAGAGIDLTGAADCTAALRRRFADGLAAGAKRFVGVQGATYKVAIPNGETLASFTRTTGITVDMSNATIDNSATSYTADTITPMFLIDGATDTTVLLRRYLGFTLPTPTSHLGYRGATLVRAINAAKGITVRARIENARYGVQSGQYGDATKGGCSDFDIKITGSMVGYPIALYRADHIRHDVDVDGIHRAVYIAGCDDVRGVARWKDQYIADTAYLITDCLTGGTDAAAQADPVGAATTSRGCSNVDVVSIDKGSTVFQPSSRCAGITLSRADGCQFRNIRVGVDSTGSDSLSTTVGGWVVASGAKSVWSRYAFNWEPTILLENVEVYGRIDHSAATRAGNAGSEFYMLTYESTTAHSATVRNFRAHGFTFLPSSGNRRPSYFQVPGLSGAASFRDFVTPGVAISLFTNGTAPTVFEGCTLDAIQDVGTTDGNFIVLAEGTVVAKEATLKSARRTMARGGTQGGAGVKTWTAEFTANLKGPSVTVANAIPAGAIVQAVQGIIQTAITGSTGYKVGVSGDIARYANRNSTAVGSAFGPAQAAATETGPRLYRATTSLVVTSKNASFRAGKLRLIVHYDSFDAPNI
jgi:hypothetical protein